MQEFKSKITKSEWAEIKNSVQYLSPLQSPCYAEMISELYKQKPRYILCKNENGQIKYYALLIENKNKRFFTHGKIKQGPVVLEDNINSEDFLNVLMELSKKDKLTTVNIEPPLFGPFLSNLRVCHEEGQYQTFITDLSLNEEELMKKIEKSWRKNIRRAEKRIQVTQVDRENDTLLEDFYNLTIETHNRVAETGFELDNLPLNFYKAYISNFVRKNKGVFNLAINGGKVIAGSGVICEGNVCLSWVSASTRGVLYERGTQHLLRWEEIKWCKNQGYHWYDFGGVNFNQTHYQNGVYTFKKRFGGEFVKSRAFNVYPSYMKYATYRLLKRIKDIKKS